LYPLMGGGGGGTENIEKNGLQVPSQQLRTSYE